VSSVRPAAMAQGRRSVREAFEGGQVWCGIEAPVAGCMVLYLYTYKSSQL